LVTKPVTAKLVLVAPYAFCPQRICPFSCDVLPWNHFLEFISHEVCISTEGQNPTLDLMLSRIVDGDEKYTQISK
jgi:hypothetical protein